MAQIKKGDAHGLARVQVILVDTDGKGYGQLTPPGTTGTTSGAYQITDPKSCTMPAPDRNTINFSGGNKWLGAFQYGIDAVGSFELSVASYDADLIALVTGSSVDQTTNTLWTYFGENDLKEELPQVALMLTYRIQARGVNEGAAIYATTIIPRCWMGPKGLTGAPSFQSGGEYGFTITPTASTVLPHGLSIDDMAVTQQDNKIFRLHVFTDNPIAFCSHVGDAGGSTSFTLPFLPTSSTVTLNNSPNELVIDGTLTAATTVATATGVVTVAVSEDTHAGIFYETAFATA